MTNPGFITVFGLPLYIYAGIITFIVLVATAVMGVLINNGKYDIPLRWHQAAAGATIIVAIIHGIIVMWAFF